MKTRQLGWMASLAGLLASLTGCGSLPTDVERTVSHAYPTPQHTALGQYVEKRRVAEGSRHANGFAMLGTVEKAYGARLALIESAQHTLDLQYYAMHADGSTEILLQRLRQAAARGVRVRILLDDVNTSGKNAQVLRLGFEPNVQLRLFNPLPMTGWPLIARFALVLHDAKNMQQRMHNKLFIADNAAGITGGRNLGNVYFGQGHDEANFVDLDVLALGPVVQDMSASFDQYWNNPLAYPVQAFTTLAELERQSQPAEATPPNGEAAGAPESAAVQRKAAQAVAQAAQSRASEVVVIGVKPDSHRAADTGVVASTKGAAAHTASVKAENRAQAAEVAASAAQAGVETVQVSSSTPTADAKMPEKAQVKPSADKVLADVAMVAPTLSTLDLARVPLTWAPALLMADKPQKISDSATVGQDAKAGGHAEAAPTDRGAATGPTGNGELATATAAGIKEPTAAASAQPPASPGVVVGQHAPAVARAGAPAAAASSAALAAQVDTQAESVVDGLLSLMASAQRDVLIISPYFVPGQAMMKVFGDARARGVRVRVLTNSLASNDAVAAHAGYARYRKALLKMGVEIYELRAENIQRPPAPGTPAAPAASAQATQTAPPRFGNQAAAADSAAAQGAGHTPSPAADRDPKASGGGAGLGSSGGGSGGKALSVGSRSSLHTKAAFFDGRTAIIGSMNLDMRSQIHNTEVALLIRSADICRQAEDLVNGTLARAAYKVELDGGQLRWLAPRGASFADETREPGASWKQKLLNLVIGPLAPDSLL